MNIAFAGGLCLDMLIILMAIKIHRSLKKKSSQDFLSAQNTK